MTAATTVPVAVRAFTEVAGIRRSQREPTLRAVLVELMEQSENELRMLQAWLRDDTPVDELRLYLAAVPSLGSVQRWLSRVRNTSPSPCHALRESLSRLLTPQQASHRPRVNRWGSLVLVLDTETTLDETQRLLYGCWRLCKWRLDGALACIGEGLFYADDLPESDPAGYETLTSYARNHSADTAPPWPRQLKLMSARRFVKTVLLRYGWKPARKALVAGFNVPFDLSRLGLSVGNARGKSSGGFSFVLSTYPDPETGSEKESPYAPRLQVVTESSKRHRIRFTGGEQGRNDNARRFGAFPGGRFIDCRTLAYALTNASHSLKSATDDGGPFPTEHKKSSVELGAISPESIDYCRNDVLVTAELLAELRTKLDRHCEALTGGKGVELLPEHAASPAALVKRHQAAMGLRPFLERQPDVDRTLLAASMEAFYGGRLETRITRTALPVVYTDGLSAYCTAAVLMQLWGFQTAERIEARPALAWTRTFLQGLTVEQLLDPIVWPELAVLVLVEPDGDVLPVRARFDGARSWTATVAPYASKEPEWRWLPDVAAAKLLSPTSTPPRIRRALRLVPIGQQSDLSPIQLFGRRICDPRTEDLYRVMVEERARVKIDSSQPEHERRRLADCVKAMGQAAAYGIGVEFQRDELPAGEQYDLAIAGREKPFTTNKPEKAGPWFAPWSSSVPAACRLLVAMLQRMVEDAGGAFVFASVDAMAIVATEAGGLLPCPGGSERIVQPGKRKPVDAVRALTWHQVDAIRERFRSLLPYDSELLPDLWRIEGENYWASGERCQLWAYALRGNHYALFNRSDQDQHVELRAVIDGDDEQGETDAETDLRKASEHGLAHVLNQQRTEEWWRWRIATELGLPANAPGWLSHPAVKMLTISRPADLRVFAQFNEGKSYAEQVKPFNFMLELGCQPDGQPLNSAAHVRLIAPFEQDASKLADWKGIDPRTGNSHPLTTARLTDDALQGRLLYGRNAELAYVATIRNVLDRYEQGCDPKMMTPDGRALRDFWPEPYRGVVTPRPLVADGTRWLVGKETHHLVATAPGVIGDLDDLQNVYAPDLEWLERETWEQLVLPVLRELRQPGMLAKAASVHPRRIRAILNTGEYPRTAARAVLHRLAVKYARQQLAIWKADLASSEAEVLRQYLDHPERQRRCPVDSQPITGRAEYCSPACKQRAYRERQRSQPESVTQAA